MKPFIFTCISTLFLTFSAYSQEVEPIEIPAELREVLDNYEKYWEARDGDALASLFTTDGYVLSSGREIVSGSEAIKQAYKYSGGPLDLRSYDFGITGNLAYIIGGYAPEEGLKSTGKFTLVLKKVDGVWKIHSDMDNRSL